MIYVTIEEARVAAKELGDALETVVKITKCEGGYELFGSGELVEIIE